MGKDFAATLDDFAPTLDDFEQEDACGFTEAFDAGRLVSAADDDLIGTSEEHE